MWIRQHRWRLERLRRDGSVVRYDVGARHERRTFLAPFDRPVHRQSASRFRYAPAHQVIARVAGALGRTFTTRSIPSAIGAELDLLPHQLAPALAVRQGARRLLIADEVGLGKTIQAGIIIAETLRRHPSARVLIAVPASLADQWTGELRQRFRIESRAGDRAGLDRLAADTSMSDDPWLLSGVWIASLDFLKQPHVLASLPARLWDLVVVDEVHTACGDSERYDACQTIASAARVVLLLTATPHDGDQARFERLLAIGALSGEADRFEVFRRTRRELNLHRSRRVRWNRVRMSQREIQTFDALSAFERSVLRDGGPSRRDAALLLLSIFRKRALSTMGALAKSLERRLDWIEGRLPPDDGARQGVLSFDESDEFGPHETEAIRADIGIDPQRERAWLKRMEVLANAAGQVDSKAARIATFAGRVREPIVIFTEFRDSLEVLRRRLERRAAIACLHGGQTGGERQAELARFLNGAASVLIATDVASLGLNLQTRARTVINLELPWNPMRLEQRAGRVDRLGQMRSVHVTLLVADHDVEAPVLRRLATRVLVARYAMNEDVIVGDFDEATVRASVLLGSHVADEPRPAISWPTPRRWSRAARAATAARVRRRLLRSYWRAPGHSMPAPRCTSSKRLTRLGVGRRGSLVIFVVPLVDASAAIVESHVVAVRVPSGWSDWREATAAAAACARESLTSRATRVARQLRSRLAVCIAREHALAERLADSRRVSDIQPGLFDRRVVRAIDTGHAEIELIHDDASRHIADLESAASIQVGDPIVVAVIGGTL